MKSSRFGLVFGLSLLLSSCASYFVRKDCEKINWFQHGHDIAMSGRRVSGDPTVERCQKADFDLPAVQLDQGFKAGMANYCKPETVYITGKGGDGFNPELCDPGQVGLLRQRHAEGVQAYCARDNGHNAGTSGKKYQGVCPAALEKDFLPEYKRGRKKYVGTILSSNRSEVAQIDVKIRDLERERSLVALRRSSLPGPRQVTERIYNATTGTYIEQTRTEDPFQHERNRLEHDENHLASRIIEQRNRQDVLHRAISEGEAELATLD